MKRVIVFMLMFVAVVSVLDTARAGFIDDWISQKTQTSPGYFEGEKRGYLTGGSFSARWQMSNDHLFSAQAPRFKVGCGGIDLFMGGFSFLNVNYLVQKFEKILQAAPALAFDMALNTLCEQCSSAMKSLEALANELNKLQMNECHDAKVLTAKIASEFTDDPKVQAEAQQNFSLQTGLQSIYSDIQSTVKANNGKPSIQNDSSMFEDCPQDVIDLFFTQGKSVLSAMAEDMNIPDAHVELMRGYVGDFQYSPYTDEDGDQTYRLVQVNPCLQNTTFGLDSFIDGSGYSRPLSAPNATCVQVTDTNANLLQWALAQVQDTYNNLLNQSGLTDADTTLINTVPLVYSNLLYAIATNQGPQVQYQIAQFAARAYAFAMVKDLFSEAAYNVKKAKEAVKLIANSPDENCQIEEIDVDVGQLDEFDKRIKEMVKIMQSDYADFVQENAALFAVSQRYEQFIKASKEGLSKTYSKNFVNRVMSKM